MYDKPFSYFSFLIFLFVISLSPVFATYVRVGARVGAEDVIDSG